MTPVTRRRVSLWIGIVLFCGGISILYSLVLSRIIPFEWTFREGAIAFRTGALVSAASAALEVFYFPTRAGAWLRRLPFLLSLFIHLLIQLFVIRAGLVIPRMLMIVLGDVNPWEEWAPGSLLRDMIFGGILLGLIFMFLQMRSLIGGRTLKNFLLGRYNKPKREDCIFLFVDVVDSTRLARQLGDRKFHQFLARFFFEIDDIIVNNGGEVHSYVGDAVIATWQMHGPALNARPVRAVFEINRRIAALAADFQAEFGASPAFRAALHGGPVVAGECGDSHRQITYLGDVVNLTARIEGAAKTLERQFLASRHLLDQMDLPEGVGAEDMGEHSLKGVEGEVGLVSLAAKV